MFEPTDVLSRFVCCGDDYRISLFQVYVGNGGHIVMICRSCGKPHSFKAEKQEKPNVRS